MKAAALLLHQSLGKPAVTTAGKMADDAISDQLERRLALLPPAELEAYLRITEKLQGSEMDSAVKTFDEIKEVVGQQGG